MCQAEKGPELTAPAAPEASEPETELLAEAKAAGLFLDRELSWLQFNRRVLEQAGDPTVPLLERLKFLGIYRSNLEEFFMVRVGSLTHRAALLPDERDEKTGCTPGEQVSAILAARPAHCCIYYSTDPRHPCRRCRAAAARGTHLPAASGRHARRWDRRAGLS